MRRLKAKTKREKCKAGRCLGKRVDNSRFCVKHVDKVLGVQGSPTNFEYKPVSWKERIKSFIFVGK